MISRSPKGALQLSRQRAICSQTTALAGKGYDSSSFRQWLRKRGTKPVIPPRRNRKVRYRYDRQLYKQRNRVERMFGRLKDYRRIARALRSQRAELYVSRVRSRHCDMVARVQRPEPNGRLH